jgi:hypothetical protein
MRRRAVVTLLVLVLSSAAAGVAGAVGPRPQPPDAAVVPDGHRVRTVRDAGLSVALPAGWQMLRHRDAVWPGVVDLRRVNPRFAPHLSGLVVADSPLELFGFDRRGAAGDAATMTVLVSRQTFGSGYAAWSAGVPAALRTLRGGGRLRSVRLDLPGGQALLSSRRGRDGELRLFAARADAIVTLTLDARATRLPCSPATGYRATGRCSSASRGRSTSPSRSCIRSVAAVRLALPALSARRRSRPLLDSRRPDPQPRRRAARPGGGCQTR